MLFPAGHPVELRFAGPSPVVAFAGPRFCCHALADSRTRGTATTHCFHSSSAPGHAVPAGPSVRHSSRWTPSSSSHCWTPGFASSILDPQLAVTRLTHQYCVTSLTQHFGTGVSLLCSLGPGLAGTACTSLDVHLLLHPHPALTSCWPVPATGLRWPHPRWVVTATAQHRNSDPNLQFSLTTGGRGPQWDSLVRVC
jgi:hypothetical protein